MSALRRERPALAWLVRWLEEHAPSNDPVSVLVHGDFRATGNFLVDRAASPPCSTREFAHFGSPYEDLSWLSVRDWRFGQLALPIGGTPREGRSTTNAYEAASGHALDTAKLHYWEVLGNVAWALGAACQTERYTHGGEEDLELLAIGRRASEMSREALRLVEKGAL